MADKKMPENAENFYCKYCDFVSSKESNYIKHISTRKHRETYKRLTNAAKKMPKNADFECKCGNVYRHRQSLYKHQKTCLHNESNTTSVHTNSVSDVTIGAIDNVTKDSEFKELILLLLKENKEIQKTFIDVLPYIKGNAEHSFNTTNTNSHNTQNFNIQMFLNDHCKNAMNLTDFIDTLPITAETYDNTIDNGLTQTITSMITNGLSQLDVLERPIHCTDATRKTLYVKEDNVWEKDNKLVRILLGIRNIASKQRTMINKWRDVNHGWDKDDNIQTRFTSLICNSMVDIENDVKETNKIIRNLSKTVYLDTDMKNKYLE